VLSGVYCCLDCRTVNDGTCSFPNNFFGCENAARGYTGGVKFIAEDYDIECEVGECCGSHWVVILSYCAAPDCGPICCLCCGLVAH
jgi:hypothetical protein